VLPALAGSLSSTFWVKRASGMDEAPMPAAPPTAQPRADATSCVDAEASKGMRMAQAKASIVFGNALVSKFLATYWFRSFWQSDSFWQRTGFEYFQTNVSGTEGCQRHQAERKVRRRKAAAGGEKAATAGKGNGTMSSCQASNASRTAGFGQDVKGAARQPAGSRAARTPAPFCPSSGGKWCRITPGQMGSGWWFCSWRGTCNRSRMQRECSLRHS
jgi:hypothetical protein